jgi:sugar (pentulose or hexulose) kinase
MSTDIVIGIDLGTQGVRILAVDDSGRILASASEMFAPFPIELPTGWAEQDPITWWNATTSCLRQLTSALPADIHISGIAIDATSGTVLPIDADGRPLHNALMYNDARSEPYVAAVRQCAPDLEEKLGYAFNASFALPKLLWLQNQIPEIASNTRYYIHATDFIAGRLTGDYAVTDYSDALKTGYDLLKEEWPEFIENELGLEISRLPRVVAPGKPIGAVTPNAASDTGLKAGTPVYGGATDGTAAQIASGTVEPGSWNSSLGTTLVIKGITRQLLVDPQRRVYNHRHPDGWWMPGGASNTGSEWIMREYPGQDIKQLDQTAVELTPTRLIRYPLARTGERFPFLRSKATGFTLALDGSSPDRSDPRYFAAGLEGTAMVERLAYETLEEIGAVVGNRIYSTGGGSKSIIWLRIRASMLNRQLVRPSSSETAMGAALLAATGAWFGNLGKASRAMIRPDVSVDPETSLIQPYDEMYAVFCAQLRLRGYL